MKQESKQTRKVVNQAYTYSSEQTDQTKKQTNQANKQTIELVLVIKSINQPNPEKNERHRLVWGPRLPTLIMLKDIHVVTIEYRRKIF